MKLRNEDVKRKKEKIMYGRHSEKIRKLYVNVIYAFVHLNQRKLYAPQYNGKLKVKACAQSERKNMLDI